MPIAIQAINNASHSSMSSVITLPAKSARVLAYSDRISKLYAATAFTPYLFASPIGPISVADRELFIPRFINITPRSIDESIRVAIIAGHDHRDERSTEAVLHLIELLLASPDVGDGLNLSFIPLADVGGLNGRKHRSSLLDADWRHPASDEIAALARDARQRAYHLFVELVTAEPGEGDDLVSATLLGVDKHDFGAYSDEFLTSEDFHPFAVRFGVDHSAPEAGPLGIAEDLPWSPLVLRIALPDNWHLALYREAVAVIARSLLTRYRTHQGYGQHI